MPEDKRSLPTKAASSDKQRLDWPSVAQSEVIGAFQHRARCAANVLLDVEDLVAYREAHPKIENTPISLTSLYVAAATKALQDEPRPMWHLHETKFYKPRTIDIGLSVAGIHPDAPMAPTVVLHDCATKSLPEISTEVFTLAKDARETEDDQRQELGRLASFLPIGWLRRLIIRKAALSPDLLREKTGVFQISNLQGTGIDLGISSVVPHTLLLIGEIRQRALVVDGEVTVRRSAWATLQYDHAEMVGTHAGVWLTAFQKWLAEPKALYDHAKAYGQQPSQIGTIPYPRETKA